MILISLSISSFKAIYHPDHFYLIHVDSRQDLMFREMSAIASDIDNIHMMRTRFATIWGGASLLEMILEAFEELSQLAWTWDYVINLSESDFPIKTLDQLTSYLRLNMGNNFVKSHGRETSEFIRKQGLDKTFVQCDDHMWKIGTRALPKGVQVDGGSDWFCLHHSFVQYLLQDSDSTLQGLKMLFKFTLLPAESFFHMALRNSKFCSSIVNNNLHLTNWNRKQGCKCQHKAVVDWCGCSPNDFKIKDWSKLNATAAKPLFFARKFEAIVSNSVINRLEAWIYGHLERANGYWQNLYHHQDVSPKAKVELLAFGAAIAKTQGPTSAQTVIEVNLYQTDDLTTQGLLVLLRANKTIEVMVKPQVLEQKVDAWVGRDIRVTVGSDFDPKEVMFRNTGGLFGPNTKLGVLIEAADGPKIQLVFVLYDSQGHPVSAKKETLERSPCQVIVWPKLPPTLSAGVWTLFVFYFQDVVMKLHFLVLPSDADEPSQRRTNTTYPSGLQPLVPFFEKETDPQIKKLIQSNDFEQQLLHFYPIQHTCSAEQVDGFDPCRDTKWSSLAPDPKSSFSIADAKPGKNSTKSINL